MIAYDMRISDWSSDVCSSDLACRNAKQRSFARRCNDIWSHSATIYALRTAVGLRDRTEAAPPPPASMRWPKPCWSHRLEERSEERRVGEECVRECRSRWSQIH